MSMVEQNVGYWACGGVSVMDPDAADPVAELRAWSRLLVALTDRLADGPLEPASPRDRVLRTMVGKATGMASATLHQIMSLRCRHPVSDLLDGDLPRG